MVERSQDLRTMIQQGLGHLLDEYPSEVREELVRRVTGIVSSEIRRERDRSVALCRHRAELWRTTSASQSSAPAIARDEARARANEAQYLSDLIADDGGFFPEADA